MKEKDSIEVVFNLTDMVETIYCFNYDYDFSTFRQDDLRVNLVRKNVIKEKPKFGIELRAKYFLNDSDSTLAEIGIYMEYSVDPYTVLLGPRDAKDNITINSVLLERLLGMTIDTLRGVAFIRLSGTPLGKYPLPLVSALKLLEKGQEDNNV